MRERGIHEVPVEAAPKTVEALTRRLDRSNLKNEQLNRLVRRLEKRVEELEAQIDYAA